MPPFPPLTAPSLVLEPVSVAHAQEMHVVLADPSIHEFLSEPPPTPDGLRAAYERRAVGRSPDGAEQWFNWMLRRDDGRLIGYVQATIEARDRCWIGYVMGREGRGRGHATRAVAAMIEYLQHEHDVWRLLASVDARNARSIALLDRLGFDLAPPHAKELGELGAGDRLYLLELISG